MTGNRNILYTLLRFTAVPLLCRSHSITHTPRGTPPPPTSVQTFRAFVRLTKGWQMTWFLPKALPCLIPTASTSPMLVQCCQNQLALSLLPCRHRIGHIFGLGSGITARKVFPTRCICSAHLRFSSYHFWCTEKNAIAYCI